MASGVVGSCNGVSVGGVGKNSGFSSSAYVSGRTADAMVLAKAGRLGPFRFVFLLGVGRMQS